MAGVVVLGISRKEAGVGFVAPSGPVLPTIECVGTTMYPVARFPIISFRAAPHHQRYSAR